MYLMLSLLSNPWSICKVKKRSIANHEFHQSFRKVTKFLYMVQVGSQKYSSRVFNFFTFIAKSAAKSSCGSLQLWLHHKIEPNNTGGGSGFFF